MPDPNNDPNKKEDMLDGFEDAGALMRKNLMNIDNFDYSATNVSYTEEGDGSYRVEWIVDDAPMIDFMKRTFPFIGGGLLIISGFLSPYLFSGFSGPGPYILALALIAWGGYSIFAALKNRQEKYTILIGIDNFSIIHDRVFHSEKLLNYNDMKSIDLLMTGTEDTWGQSMSITEKMERHQITGKKESVELLCKTVDVLFRRIKAKRKKLGKTEEMTVVGQ